MRRNSQECMCIGNNKILAVAATNRVCRAKLQDEERQIMIYLAKKEDIDIILQVTGDTISAIYPHYYAPGVVAFFLQHHCRENVEKDVEDGLVYLLTVQDRVVGTVTIKENVINRLFVLPECQGNGYGRKLMDFAEAEITKHYESIHIDSSLPAKEMYLKRGYRETGTRRINVDFDDVLVYDEMKK